MVKAVISVIQKSNHLNLTIDIPKKGHIIAGIITHKKMCKYLNKNHKNYNSLLQSPQQNPFNHFETKFFCDKSYEKKRNETRKKEK